MSLFQNTIVSKYLATLDSSRIDDAYQRFCAYFHDAERQKNIMQSKEEQFQEGFLRELFVNILGYTLNPDPGYDLITEKKDTKDAKKADGAILADGEVVAVIELKDHKTTDLDKVERQAFGYKNQHKKATYVITSNFFRLRFYIDNAVENVEWDLFKLTREDFSLMWLCLSRESLLRGLPKMLKNESVSNEEQITNQLYKDYITFKRVLFADILQRNTTEEGEHSTTEWKILLFKKTQKLLDRLLFIFFAEDGGLLPPNATVGIINDWQKLKDLDAYTPLYKRIRQYFTYLDQGKPEKGIFAYNGGLFKADEVLDSLSIDDDLLATHTRKLSEYDFCSDVDVNILGHIFENSLTEIEEVTAQLEQGAAPAVSKRKKDGVFYTPQYITKYIVENTVGRLCAEKKDSLGINDIEYFSDENFSTKRKHQMMEAINEYREWLLQLTICDPACGSGAFLNAALRFLMDEHHTLDEMEANITGGTIVFENIENSILENNLYGVDINEESVEIARLALWLRTAKPQRKLSSLNNNIKCGNSLISDPAVAGDKAFDWEKEFPQVFAKGGFDVVIGNPPYVQLQSLGIMSDKYAQCGYEVYNKGADLYCLFYERGWQILKQYGILGYIASDKWIKVNYAVQLRRFFVTKCNPYQFIDFPGVPVFIDATVDPQILLFKKEPYKGKVNACVIDKSVQSIDDFVVENNVIQNFTADAWIISDPKIAKFERKLTEGNALKDLPININYGLKTGYNDAYFINEEIRDRLTSEDAKNAEWIKPLIRGRDIVPWSNSIDNQYLIFIPWHFPNHLSFDGLGASAECEEDFKEQYSSLYNYLCSHKEKLSARNKAETGIRYEWYALQRWGADYYKEFSKPKIVYPNMTKYLPFMYDEKGYFGNDKTFIITAKDDSVDLKFLASILNSTLCKYWIRRNCPELGEDRREIRKVYFENFCIPECSNLQPFIALADKMITLTSALQQHRARFQRRMTENISDLKKITSALETFDHLTFEEFHKELKKQKVKLSLAQQDEWEEYFTQKKQQCTDIEAQIAQTDKEIDNLVYDLYGLTEEERKIVENQK